MDWTQNNWVLEDQLYYPKRRIDNKISWQRPHIIGSIISTKMEERDVEYHSLNERLFYYLLELDPGVIRYYVQPVEIAIKHLDSEGQEKSWMHVPDTLVFRQNQIPLLVQIKESPDEQTKTFLRCNRACSLHAEREGWKYVVIYPKTLPDKVLINLKFLSQFRKSREYYKQWIDQVMNKAGYLEGASIIELALSFSGLTDFRIILPMIYHLIANGKLGTNILEKVSEQSTFSVGNVMNPFEQAFRTGGYLDEVTQL
ncbi:MULTISPECIES: TnsA endonuclease N-terminal domain-containing protein [Paenibacillus]|uniref:TnsA endonuclease N-terminal domain-containing protein n=1 Tax=Paenibacillus TaxID=44249 RepID=UPI00097018DD|nr:TnsA endonuclease N-terminal domain-containing protein [Paenibacillus odorifer]OMD17306.1 hypothetical protein BJP50_16300 [Paenibacillus odorifer]